MKLGVIRCGSLRGRTSDYSELGTSGLDLLRRVTFEFFEIFIEHFCHLGQCFLELLLVLPRFLWIQDFGVHSFQAHWVL